MKGQISNKQITLQIKQTTDSIEHKNKKGCHTQNNHNEQQIKFLFVQTPKYGRWSI